jgi:hypothetical protein
MTKPVRILAPGSRRKVDGWVTAPGHEREPPMSNAPRTAVGRPRCEGARSRAPASRSGVAILCRRRADDRGEDARSTCSTDFVTLVAGGLARAPRAFARANDAAPRSGSNPSKSWQAAPDFAPHGQQNPEQTLQFCMDYCTYVLNFWSEETRVQASTLFPKIVFDKGGAPAY